MKKKVAVNRANRLINSGCVILVSTRHQLKNNIITLAWQTPLSHDPMLLGISVGHSRFSHDMIKKSGEFVINVPHKPLLSQTHGCGRVSGKDVNKFKKFSLHTQNSHHVKPPGIQECVAQIECSLYKTVDTGDHSLFIGEAVYAGAEEGLFDFERGVWKIVAEKELLHHLGGNLYVTPQKIHTA